jgi:ribosomal subunit interface protein
MNKRITYRGIESTPVLEEFINSHLEKVVKILEHEPTPIMIDFVLGASTVHAHHKVELRIKTPHYDLIAHHEGPEMYQEIDKVVDKMVREIRRAKEKRIDEKKNADFFKSA